MSFINSKHYRNWTVLFALFCLICAMGTMRPLAAENVVATAAKAAKGEWEKDGDGRRYCLNKNGKYIKDAWKVIQGNVYHFDEQGYVETDWFKYNGDKYYADAKGRLYVNRWLKKDEKYYFLRADGTLARKCVIKSWGYYFYVNKHGVRVANKWVTINGKKYYFNWEGARVQSSWIRYGDNFYYLDASGAMLVNKWIGKTHYVGEDGAMKKSCVVDGYYLDANGKRSFKVIPGNYIFVGDSRTEGMRLSVDSSNTKYIAMVSMGYAWLEQTAGPELQKSLRSNPNVAVILALGINDLEDIDRYISYYKKLMAKFPKTRWYVMSVNPVDEAQEAVYGYSVKNSEIESFNKKMYAAVGKDRYLNTYWYLKKKGFTTVDGIHYTSSVYRNLYDYVFTLLNQ